jgi:hypothetical protein
MEMQEMEITIDKEGKILVKVSGAHGTDCLAITKHIEEASGVVEERTCSPEYYEQPVSVEQNNRIRRY